MDEAGGIKHQPCQYWACPFNLLCILYVFCTMQIRFLLSVYNILCTMYTRLSPVHSTVQCTLYSVQQCLHSPGVLPVSSELSTQTCRNCTVYGVQCTVQFVQHTVYSLHCYELQTVNCVGCHCTLQTLLAVSLVLSTQTCRNPPSILISYCSVHSTLNTLHSTLNTLHVELNILH